MTQVFSQGPPNCSVSETEKCYSSNCTPFKVLLVGNAPGHLSFIGHLHHSIKVVFLPPNTNSLFQPLGQRVTAALKAYSPKRTFVQAVAATEEDTEETLVQLREA